MYPSPKCHNGAVAWTALLACAITLHTDAPLITDGERVLFYGDSITASQKYTDVLESMIRLRYPTSRFFFINVGQGSDSTWGGPIGSAYQRVSRDVVPFHPTMISVMLGMNDGGYVSYNDRLKDNFQDAYARLVDGMQNAHTGARFTFLLTSPYDAVAHSAATEWPDFAPDYNAALLKYGTVVKQQSDVRGGIYVDLNAPLLGLIQQGVKRDAKLARQIIPDCIHPSDPAHVVMAGEIARAWGMGPNVTRVEIDGASGALLSTENCEVAGLTELSWKQTDRALPYSVPDDALSRFVLQLSSWGQGNRQMLQVNHLAPGSYVLTVGGKKVGEFSEKALAAGVNTSGLDLPMRQLSRQVQDLVYEKNKAVRKAWLKRRIGDVDGLNDELEAVSQPYVAKMRELLLQPHTYQWELKRFADDVVP